MKNNVPPGSNPDPRRGDMTPIERQLWLKLRNAPPNMLLVTQEEFAAIHNQMQRALALDAECKAAIDELDAYGYWLTEPDLKNAAGSAAFDARRYERATTHAIGVLQRVVDG